MLHLRLFAARRDIYASQLLAADLDGPQAMLDAYAYVNAGDRGVARVRTVRRKQPRDGRSRCPHRSDRATSAAPRWTRT